MVERVRLDADAQPLINAINRGTEAWNRFNLAQTQVVKESAKLTRSGVLVTRRLQSIDSQGRKLTATFKGTAGAMQLVSTSVTKVDASVEAARKSTTGFGKSLRDIRRAVGFSLLFRSVTALTQALSEGTENAIEFSRRIAEIQTIQGRTVLTTDQWTNNLRELSDSFGIDILTQAEAAYQTLSNQVAKGRDTFVFLESANKLALTAVTDTASSVNLLTSAINAFGLDVSQADQISAQFFKTVELGRVRISELADIFGRVAVPASQLGIGIDEIQASIAAITIQGVRSEEALTLIRNVILKLIRPTDEMKRIFSELGVATAEAGIAAFGFGGFLGQIEKNVGGTTSALGKAFGRVRAITGALIFASESGAKAFNETLAELNDPKLLQNFQKNFETVFDSNGEVIRRETNRLRNFFQVELGQEVLKAVADFARNFGGITPVIESTANVIKFLLAPALVLLSARLLTVGKSALIGTAGLKAFALANPFTAILVAGAVAAEIFDAIADSSEKSAERIRKANEALTKRLTQDAQDSRKAIIKEAEIVAKTLQLGTRVFVEPLTESIGDLNREFTQLNRDAKAFNKEIKRGADATLKAADATIKKTNTFLTTLTKTAKSARDEIREATTETGEDVFKLRLDAADPERRLQLIRDRIEELEKIRSAAVKQGDIKSFNETQKLIKDLVIERDNLFFKAQQQVTAEDRVNLAVQTRQDILKEEVRLREELIKTVRVQEAAANRVRVQQELLRKDLSTALTTFRGEGLTEALGGEDESQIRRSLAERQNAAERLVALQEKLGVTQVAAGEIALSQQRDLENATNRINALRLNAVIKERQELDKQIKARLDAAAEEQTIRSKSINEEIQKLSRLRSALGSQVQLQGFAQSNITGGADITALTQAIGLGPVRSVDALSEALQPTVSRLNQLIGILERDPSRVTPEQRSQSNQLRTEILADIDRLRTERGRDLSREQLETQLQSRLGRPEGGIPLFGDPDRVTQEEIDKDLKSVLSVFDALEEGTKRLTSGTDELLDNRKRLQESEEQAIADARAISVAEKERLNALRVGTEVTDEVVKQQESLADLLKRRNALADPATDGQLGLGLDQQSATDTTKKAITAAAPQLASSYKAAVQGAAPDVKKSQIDAVLAAERERQRAAKAAEAGPEAAQKAAEKATTSGVERRRVEAEARAQQRRDEIAEARRIQDERIASFEREKVARAPRDLREEAIGQEDIIQAALAEEVFERGGEAAAKAALRAAEQQDLERRFGPIAEVQAIDPLAIAGRRREVVEEGFDFGEDLQLGLQPVTRGTNLLSEGLNNATSRLDLFNERLQATLDILIGDQASDAIARDRIGIPLVPIPSQINQLGDTSSAIQGFDLATRTAQLQLQSLTTEQDKAARSLANLTIVIDNLLRSPSFFPNSIDEFVPNIGGPIGFAGGGQVPGIGSSDSVPALLTPGEYVSTKETTRRFLPDLIRMGGIKPRRFQDGGLVGDINFGGFKVTESKNPQATALEIQRIINRGVRQGIIKIKS